MLLLNSDVLERKMIDEKRGTLGCLRFTAIPGAQRFFAGWFGARSADADLAGALRLHLNGELGSGSGKLSIQGRNLAVEIVEIVDGLGLDADLGELCIRITELLRRLLHRLELTRHLVPSLRTNQRGIEPRDLLLAPRKRLQRRLDAGDLFKRALDRGARLLFAGLQLGKLLCQGRFGLTIGIDPGGQLAELAEVLRGTFDTAFGAGLFSLVGAKLLNRGSRLRQTIPGVGKVLCELLHGGRIGQFAQVPSMLKQSVELRLEGGQFGLTFRLGRAPSFGIVDRRMQRTIGLGVLLGGGQVAPQSAGDAIKHVPRALPADQRSDL